MTTLSRFTLYIVTGTCLLLAATIQAQNEERDVYFDWPMGSCHEGKLVLGHGYYIMQNFANHNSDVGDCGTTYHCYHAGIDLALLGNVPGIVGQPILAAADGVVGCFGDFGVNEGGVVVLRHDIPGGDPVYSAYTHLAQRSDADNPFVDLGDSVRRGQPVGTVIPWYQNPQSGYNHLHFEIRDELEAPTRGGGTSCQGRGYAIDTHPTNEVFLDPIAHYFNQVNRPPFPDFAVTDPEHQDETNHSWPTRLNAFCLGELSPGEEINRRQVRSSAEISDNNILVEALEPTSLVEAVDVVPGIDATDTTHWYHIRFEDDDGQQREGYVLSFDEGTWQSALCVGESLRVGQDWRPPLVEPLIDFRFAADDFEDGWLENWGQLDEVRGQLVGNVQPALPYEHLPPDFCDQVADLDNAGQYVAANSDDLCLSGGFAFDAFVWRASNNGIDTIAGSWAPEEEWRLAFEPNDDGELVFEVRLRDGSAQELRYAIPLTDEHVERWMHVAAVYDPQPQAGEDHLRLYWDGLEVETAQLGEAGLFFDNEGLRFGGLPGDYAADFDGRLDNVRLWALGGCPPKVDVVLVIDSSGSMRWNDPYGLRKTAGRVYVHPVSSDGDYVGVVDFDSRAKILSYLRSIPENESWLRYQISRIDSWGGTDIGAGVLRGCQVLSASTSENVNKAAILLTDGVGTYRGWENQCFVDNERWTLHAFGFGSANMNQLEEIVENTGGAAEWLPEPLDFLCEFQRMRTKLIGVEPEACSHLWIMPWEIMSFYVSVALNQIQAVFSAAWPGSDVVMTLRAPSGRIIDRDTVAPDVAHDLGSTFEVYAITLPEPGEWEVTLYGAELPAGGEPVTFGFTTLPVTEQSNNPPDVSAATAGPPVLWPPNHKMRAVQIFDVTDPDGDDFTISITGITQDEPVTGPDDTSPDGEGVGTDLAFIRAERRGEGNGRIYEISFVATDVKGAQSFGSVLVCVPHDRADHSGCVDDGQIYDSTGP